jgi:hypothetical protein
VTAIGALRLSMNRRILSCVSDCVCIGGGVGGGLETSCITQICTCKAYVYLHGICVYTKNLYRGVYSYSAHACTLKGYTDVYIPCLCVYTINAKNKPKSSCKSKVLSLLVSSSPAGPYTECVLSIYDVEYVLSLLCVAGDPT